MSINSNNKPAKSQSHITTGLTVLVLLLLASAYVWSQIQVFNDYRTRDTWQTTEGVIARNNSKTHWLQYEYQVDGETYYNTRFSLTDDGRSDSNIPFNNQHLRSEYPDGQEVTVYYNPDDPNRAVLVLRFDFRMYMLMGGVLVAVIGGIIVARWLLARYLKFVGGMLSGKMWRDDT